MWNGAQQSMAIQRHAYQFVFAALIAILKCSSAFPINLLDQTLVASNSLPEVIPRMLP